MKMTFPGRTLAMTIAAAMLLALPASGEEKAGHAHAQDERIYKGYFDDDQIQPRSLGDWAGDWQSVYPLLMNGDLDVVMEHKAETGDQTAEAYRATYEVGYETVVERITIEGDTVTFYRGGVPVSGRYADDGFAVLTYKKGNRGVRYIFSKSEGDDAAPAFIQFSDHRIAPAHADHYHLYWGDDRAALLEEVTNWPTYYPFDLGPEEIADAMMAH